jgi:hypothetical protein
MSQRPPKFCPVTTSDIAFFIKERLEVYKGSDRFDLSLEPTSLFSSSQILQTTQTQDHIGLPHELKFMLTFDNINPSALTDHII